MKPLFYLITALLLTVSCSSSRSFSEAETKLIMSADSLTPMRVYKITNREDSLLLRTPSGTIKADPNNPAIKHFVSRLFATVRDSISMGVGIAAPQVGVLKNIIWVQRFDKENMPFEVYLNPKITKYSKKKQSVREGCLSIPNRSDVLNCRSNRIEIEYDTMENEHKKETVEAFTAVIFQHEIDHLSGILYLDHLKKEMEDAKTKTTND
ncbi:peptide deformylase [Tamlana sp. 2_MG-2023]|uniref:peptide deformylase n=1 Tax=unclassified Tamlana TaxID=2614803 RepID=UPI0026E39466|nr:MULTISPECIES: peptide deformylase [unclassified Tamlana]MDO6760755.1 peptide deformylase [Tamlana sp. 2_MG-2023]MDO6791011.1 peptide deformylase [Tamlana sp. 1_MG-2023]